MFSPQGVEPSGDLPILYRLTDQLYRAQTLEDILAAALDGIVLDRGLPFFSSTKPA